MKILVIDFKGDSAYGVCDWLMPPFRRNPENPAEQRFNVAHKKTRRIVECSFGMLKNRFPCLRFLRVQTPEYAAKIVMVCVIVHNIATKSDFPDEEEHFDDEAEYDGEPIGLNGNARLENLLNFFR